jgi:hypothetical protein
MTIIAMHSATSAHTSFMSFNYTSYMLCGCANFTAIIYTNFMTCKNTNFVMIKYTTFMSIDSANLVSDRSKAL